VNSITHTGHSAAELTALRSEPRDSAEAAELMFTEVYCYYNYCIAYVHM